MDVTVEQRSPPASIVVFGVCMLVALWAFAGVGKDGTARAAVGDATGPLVSNSLGNSAILSAQKMAPGTARTGEVTVTNVGDTAGAFALGARDVVDTGGTARLSRALDLTVIDVTAGSSAYLVYSGKLGELPPLALGTFAQNEARRYRFIVSFAGAAASVDNPFQGAGTSLAFVWTSSAVREPTTTTPTPTPTTTTPKPTPTTPTIAPPPTKPAAVPLALTAASKQRLSTTGSVAYATCLAACRATVTATVRIGRGRPVALKAQKRSLKAARKTKLALPVTGKLLTSVSNALTARKTVVLRVTIRAKVGAKTLSVVRSVSMLAPKRTTAKP